MKYFTALTALSSVLIAGCAAPGGGANYAVAGEEQIRSGVITRIDPVAMEHPHEIGLGAVLGAAAGGLVGNQIGRGHGRDVATVIGAIGGGIVGDQVQNAHAQPIAGQHIFVQLSNGVTAAVTQNADPNLRVGDRVIIQGSGQNARVVRRR